jgi:hypothetical protein
MNVLQPRDLQYVDAVEGMYMSLLERGRSSEALELDLSNTSFVKPISILSLATVARLWKRWTGQPIAVINLRRSVHAYLERMDLFTEFSDSLIVDGQLDNSDRWSALQTAIGCSRYFQFQVRKQLTRNR